MASHYLSLSDKPLRFTPVNQNTNVFFDEANCEVFTVDKRASKDGDSGLVVVKNIRDSRDLQFQVQHCSQITSIKFSPNRNILSVLRSSRTINFFNCQNYNIDPIDYSQTCKSQRATISGFHWTSNSEIVFITNQGVEYYQIYSERKATKLLKMYSVNVNWYIYHPRYSTLVVSSSAAGNVLQPYMFQNGQPTKLPKFEAAKGISSGPLQERDVVLAVLYGQLYVLVLRNVPRTQSVAMSAPALGSTAGDVVLYALTKESPARISAVLSVNIPGRFALHIIDNLVVVHHQNAKVSLLYDVFHAISDPDQIPTIFPILAPLPIEATHITFQGSELVHGVKAGARYTCEHYTSSWIVFQPDIIIDAKLGCIWHVSVKLNILERMITDKNQLLDLLLLREKGKQPILILCKQALKPGEQNSLQVIASLFDQVNSACKETIANEDLKQPIPTRGIFDKSVQKRVTIDQSELYCEVFSAYMDSEKASPRFLIVVLIDYIRSLNYYRLQVQYCICELLISLLVENKSFYQLHQLFQYRVFSDSKPLACLMLSLEKTYPPAFQLAMDMLKRTSACTEDVVETLLSKKQILAALQFMENIGHTEALSARKYLELAQSAGDKLLFFSVLKYFEGRNIRLRGSPEFAPEEYCVNFVEQFQKLYVL